MRVRIAGVSSYLPERVVSSREVVERVRQESLFPIRLPNGMLEFVTGIQHRRYMDDAMNASDLAVLASRDVLAKTETAADDVELIVFASASQDVAEPATAHIVQHKLGTNAPVMDVKNACNSFVNGIQVAEALILSGQYKNALVCGGETPSRSIKWAIDSRDDLRERMAGYTFGDAGAAVLLEATPDDTGLFYRKFQSVSQYWDIGGLFGGGSMYPRDERYTYFFGDATRLKDAFLETGPGLLHTAMHETGLRFEDFSRIIVHQVTAAFLNLFLDVTCIPADKVEVTLTELGNMASASMPVAFSLAEGRGDIQRGDKVMFVGLAGGLSLCVMMFEY